MACVRPAAHAGGVSRGPGVKQRALLAAVKAASGGAVWVVPRGVSGMEAASWRRAAKRLAQDGKVLAMYFRRIDRSGRALRHLAVSAPDSAAWLESDAFPLASPWWVVPAPPFIFTFSSVVQAYMLEHATGLPCTPRTAARLARQWRGDPGAGAAFVTASGEAAA